MKITKLTLTNFRSFQKAQSIDFSPVTLLFGPNSVGKSSVLMGLFYLHHFLKTGECNPLRIDGLNNKYVGGFKNLIHGRDLTEAMVIRLDFDKYNVIGSNYSELADLFEDFDLILDSPNASSRYVGIEFEICWSEIRETAYIARYRIFLDGGLIAELTSDSGLKQPIISYINYAHPLLLPENHNEWLVNAFENELPFHPENKQMLFDLLETTSSDVRAINHGEDSQDEINGKELLFSEDAFVSEFHQLLNQSRGKLTRYMNNGIDDPDESILSLHHMPISFSGVSGALPKLGRKLNLSLDLSIDYDVIDYSDAINASQKLKQFEARATEILSDTVVAPLDDLLKLLEQSLCIGPLRVVPDDQFILNPNSKQGQWYNGAAAWHSLLNADENLLNKISSWLSDKDKFDLEYGLALRKTKAITEVSVVNGPSMGSPEEGYHLPRDYKEHFRVALWDEKKELDVAPNEVGAGISQLMPLIVATLSRKRGIIACEQPELHIHPRVQVAVADLLTQVNGGPQFLIETHSEHLILRLLKRIRQTTDNEIPEGFQPVNVSDVSIVCLEPSESGVVVRQITVDEDGEFTSRWPRGFFSERREELM
ncbi:AAA family ATPase [Vibrio harveyi]|uniref:AAA family ATPase n=1 Tax=Vibrio harveyi TaxID=669 RepID=UPI0004115869|nr:AAA family ATPase [Vibrio harveyi]